MRRWRSTSRTTARGSRSSTSRARRPLPPAILLHSLELPLRPVRLRSTRSWPICRSSAGYAGERAPARGIGDACRHVPEKQDSRIGEDAQLE